MICDTTITIHRLNPKVKNISPTTTSQTEELRDFYNNQDSHDIKNQYKYSTT